MRPGDFVPLAPRDARRMMLAVTGRNRVARLVTGGPDMERWARAWARRWYVLVAASTDQARDAIARYEEKVARTSLSQPIDGSAYGILECGRNTAGAPGHPPWSHRRRATERAPTALGGPAR